MKTSINLAETSLPSGLTQEQANQLLAAGKGNIALDKKTRSVAKIIFDNVFTLFNLINAILGVVVLLVSLIDPIYFRNLLFIGVVIANTFIYSFQEIRAKLAIDKLAILTEPVSIVRRDGVEKSIPVDQLVPGDVQHIKAGQQVVIDGQILLSDGLEIDEALLTGESNPVTKFPGDKVLSGSVIMSGEGYIEVTKVANETFAARIEGDAKREGRLHSPLMRSLNKILKNISWIIFPLGIILIGHSYFYGEPGQTLRSIVTTAGLLVSMLPEGLVLLTSVALAMSVVRLGQVKTLVQTVPSVETLARVDVLCLDKTGTLTTGKISLLGLVDLEQQTVTIYQPGDETDSLSDGLEQYTTADSADPNLTRALASLAVVFPEGNATQEAISRVFTDQTGTWQQEEHVVFSSKRKWSGASFSGQGSWYVGAAEKLLRQSQLDQLNPLMDQIAQSGYRLVLLAQSSHLMTDGVEDQKSDIIPRAILIMAEELRHDAAGTLEYFQEQGVQIKLISGDHPKTLEGIAKRAGISDYERLVDMSHYPEDGNFSDLVNDHLLFGRVSPFQKRQLLKALQDQGHVVAMTGDGVNDVLALKDADCGVAMASGSDAARAAADIVLLDDQMGRMLDAVAEGRRVINNIQRVASLFLIKTTYAILFALSILPLRISYPILPIQGTLINSLTVGIPAFILALKPNRERVLGRFLANVMPMAWPAGLSAALMLIVLQMIEKRYALPPEVISSYGTFIVITISLRALFAVSQPFDRIKRLLFTFCLALPLGALFLLPDLLMIQLPRGSQWLTFVGWIVMSLTVTEGMYRWSRSYPARQWSRKILGPSREDILKEEQDRLRDQQSRRLYNLRDRFRGRRKYRLRSWRWRRSGSQSEDIAKPKKSDKDDQNR